MNASVVAVDPEEVPVVPLRPLVGAYRNYAMGLLLAISIMNYLDRQVVHILAEPIKNELGLADWQLGMLTGLAFGVLYTLLGLPIARLAERGNRPYIIATATAVWSLFTVLCGTVHSFWQLALARVGVGIGEAGCTPPAHSLIMDYTEPAKRGSALAFYGMGAPLGGLLGMAFGGLVADAFGWRAAFLLAGVPGLLFAILTFLTLKEPRRERPAQASGKLAENETLGAMLRLVSAKRSYWLLGAAITCNVFIAYGHGPFIASFYLRNHSAELAQAASATGALFGFTLGPVGFLGTGAWPAGRHLRRGGHLPGRPLADRFGPSDPRRYVYLPALAVAAVRADLHRRDDGALNRGSRWHFSVLNALIGNTWYGPAYTAWFSLVPAHMRATNSARQPVRRQSDRAGARAAWCGHTQRCLRGVDGVGRGDPLGA